MMNLLGSTKEDFYTLLSLMGYKKDKENDTYIFSGDQRKNKKVFKNKINSGPFDKLLSLNIK